MYTLFIEGGFIMWIILAFGVVALATSFIFATRPAEHNVRFIKGMSAVVVFSTLCGICQCISTTIHNVTGPMVAPDQRWIILTEGIGESLAPGVMGFAIVALVALFLAVGQRRLDARKE